MYFSIDTAHQIWKIVEEDHNIAIEKAYKSYNKDWANEKDSQNIELKLDFYKNAEVIAIVDAPINKIDIVYHELAYNMPLDPNESF